MTVGYGHMAIYFGIIRKFVNRLTWNAKTDLAKYIVSRLVAQFNEMARVKDLPGSGRSKLNDTKLKFY